MSIKILGISAQYHDSAAALVIDGIVVAAASEERFSRLKHDSSIPVRAAEWCLKHAGITIDDVDFVRRTDEEASAQGVGWKWVSN